MSEVQLVKNILKKLRSTTQQEGLWIKIHGGPFQVVGLPDIIGLYKGRFYGFEIKLPGKEDTLTAVQQYYIDRINNCGGVSLMATSVREVIQALK